MFYPSAAGNLFYEQVNSKSGNKTNQEKKKKTRGPWRPWVAHLSIIETKLFQNLSTGLAEEVV